MKGKYAEMILSGKKVTTIRPGKVQIGSRTIYIHAGGLIIARAQIEDVRFKRLADIDDNDARLDGFSNSNELVKELKSYYPSLKDHSWVTIIKFRILEKMNLPESSNYAGRTAIEIAQIALRNLDKLNLTQNEIAILKTLVETKSLRATSQRFYGSIRYRRKIRKLLLKLVDKLQELRLL